MGCMNDKTYDGSCKLCGYSDLDPCIPAYLTPKTYLNDRYIVGRLLSYNGEGATYIGYDTAAGTKVTVREFMPDTLCTRKKGETEIVVNSNNSALYKTYLSEFADLNRSLMKLRGMAHIQTVLDVFFENNTCYAVFEFISGISLKTFLANSSGGLMWEQVKELFPPILTTISIFHEAGIIHRGISPQTIFVTDKMELLLAGFNITAARTTNTEIACEIFSGYASPEQYTNDVNGTWTDVYGISSVLYRVLTGAVPTEAIARTKGSMLEPMMVNRNVPPNVSKVIMQGMRLSPENRIQSIREFVDLLFAPPRYVPGENSPHSENVRTYPPTPREEKKFRKKKKEERKFFIILCGIGALLIAFAIAFAVSFSGACTPDEPLTSEISSSGTSTANSTNDSTPAESSDTSADPDTSTSSEGESSEVTSNVPTMEVPDFTNYRYESTATTYSTIFTFIPTYVYSDTVAAGLMYDQSVEPGKVVPFGTQIKVKVSKGRSIVPLPDFKGQTEDKYVEQLTKLNIKYAIETEKNNDVPNGRITRCSKEVGDLVDVENGETITVYVAENFEESEPTSEPESSQTEE